MGDPSSSVGPGFGAFVAFFLLAFALWLLMRNMNARMRRMAYREQERVQALAAEQGAEPGPGPAGTHTPARTGTQAGATDGSSAAPGGSDTPDGEDQPGPPSGRGR